MRYHFTDLDNAPLEEYGLTFMYGGEVPDDKIDGFEVLTVSGRELMGDEIDYTTTDDRDGGVIVAQSLPVRILTIQYRLMADSDEECRNAFNKLNAFLRKGGKVDKPIVFSDEPEATFYGRFHTADDAPADRNKLVSSFTFLCVDPYKYVQEYVFKGNQQVLLNNLTPYELKPAKIKLTPATSVSKIVLTNNSTGRKIVLNGSYLANGTVEVKIPENTILVSGEKRMQDLDYVESDFHKFLVSSGNVISVSPPMPIELTVRGRWL